MVKVAYVSETDTGTPVFAHHLRWRHRMNSLLLQTNPLRSLWCWIRTVSLACASPVATAAMPRVASTVKVDTSALSARQKLLQQSACAARSSSSGGCPCQWRVPCRGASSLNGPRYGCRQVIACSAASRHGRLTARRCMWASELGPPATHARHLAIRRQGWRQRSLICDSMGSRAQCALRVICCRASMQRCQVASKVRGASGPTQARTIVYVATRMVSTLRRPSDRSYAVSARRICRAGRVRPVR